MLFDICLIFLGGGGWRCREVEQDVATLKAQLVEKQAVQTENDRLKLQLNSMQAQSLMEQRKTAEEKSEKTQAYIHINWLCESAETAYCDTDFHRVVLLYFDYTELLKQSGHFTQIAKHNLLNTGTTWRSWRTPTPNCLRTTLSSKTRNREKR